MSSNIFTLEEKQVLIYGAPGTGKSYQLNRTISEHEFVGAIDENY